MPVRQFTLDALDDLDSGKAIEAFNLHIRRAAQDCYDRPGDDKPRKVKLEVSFTPVMDDEGDCNEVKAQIYASSAVPTHRTKTYSFGLRANGVVVFNPDSPDCVDQTTLIPDDNDEDDDR